jgi:hypothetical protein
MQPPSGPPGSSVEIAAVVHGRKRSIDGFDAVRVLPAAERRLIGSFCFFDHVGPVALAPGQAIDVRPHPHIGLATVTYLFEGEVLHQDSLGYKQVIRPGEINWMTAGRGIVHSERTPYELRATGSRLHLIQLWVALPVAHEETEPEFHHHPAETLPEIRRGDVRLRVLAGSAYGATSPVRTYSDLFYVEVSAPRGGPVPLPDEPAERSAYVVDGAVTVGGQRFEPKTLLVLGPGMGSLTAEPATTLLLLGGATVDGPRHLEWNFVSSSAERIERAKDDWRNKRFPTVPGDDQEFIPLP